MNWGRDPHPACPFGCGELADECRCAHPNPLGSMRIEEPIGSQSLSRLAEMAPRDKETT